ncbi:MULTISPECIES: Bug family tripartite tricarboxylate transporter substrate binding protein [Achromobacter]|uniref:Tripartite tricarboxylate transporter substrate binding protein n=1 Tax=Achromobacter denitrificans TaxID=32002 RepID=A0A6N0JF11_ACHDE|nr:MULTISPECIES: tripartite tricarboxylate transporter substrate binding protein [Achromobacter]ASC65848.1 tripartite tricarboxylate transporter substrate binding protein [Achromobacter denitrificans]MDF3847217.1 tripartite tricarboxylate transporter substrate binding protein [Achromobacter denitrificans]MDF3858448.1 tripartite tricarboxylate transporter substrate binding protein [Achromobacter denitrificans]MPT41601.1 tripartite tricarboxylate transporter substrate binding protein [Achromobact
MHRRSFMKIGGAASVAALGLPFGVRAAGGFPEKPIRVMVGFSAGGVTDIVVRALAESASSVFGQPIIVENKLGAGGVMPAYQLQNATPDGYTVGLIAHSVFRLPYISNIKWDPAADLDYIIRLTGFTWGLVVAADSPIKTFEDYVAYARKNPGKMTYGTVGSLTTQHLTMEQISASLGLQLTNVPYKGVAEALPALMGGHIMSVADASSWVPYVTSGKMRLLVVWTEKRVPRFPDVPTLREVGIDMVQTSPWGLAAPKGTPPEAIRRLHDGFKEAMAQKPFQDALANYDMEQQYMDGTAYRQFARESIDKENRILASLNVPRGGQ